MMTASVGVAGASVGAGKVKVAVGGAGVEVGVIVIVAGASNRGDAGEVMMLPHATKDKELREAA